MAVHSKIEPPKRATRKRVLLIATLISCDGAQRVRVRDFSRKGAQLVVENGAVPKCDVLLKRGDMCAAAHVAWVKGEEVGLTFYGEFSPDDFAA